MKKTINILLCLILFISCNNNTGADRELAFREFMKKFKPLEIPLTINVHSDFNCNCEVLEQESSDSLFINFRNRNTVSFGYLPDTTNFYAFIYFYSGDAPYFWVSTFDKSFNKIADTSILNQDGYMPATRCLEGSSHIVFNKDFRFVTIDTLKYLNCDSLGEEIGLKDSVVYKNVLIKTTSIENNGSIRIKEN
jgi:hypothetical protein